MESEASRWPQESGALALRRSDSGSSMDGDVQGLTVLGDRWRRYTNFIHRTLMEGDEFVMIFCSRDKVEGGRSKEASRDSDLLMPACTCEVLYRTFTGIATATVSLRDVWLI